MVEQIKSEGEGPRDKYRMVYIIFYWLGIGTLLPWNMFISVQAYWNHKFRTVGSELVPGNKNETESNDLQKAWGGYLSAASMVPNVTLLILNGFFGHKFKTQPRLIVSLILVILLFTFTSVMVKVDTDNWQDEFLGLTLGSVVLININAAIFQGGILGVAGKFPPAYMGAVFSGQAVGGIFASGCNVVFLALGATAEESGFFCFITSVVFLFSALVAYAIATRSDFYQFYLGEKSVELKEKKPEDSKLLDTDDGRPAVPVRVNPFTVLIQISPYAGAVFSCFLVTLGTFPAITAQVVSTMPPDSAWAKVFFVPVSCFLLFNIGDYIGRFLAGLVQWPRPGKVGSYVTLGLALLRFVFLPLFLYCNIRPTDRSITSVAFESDTAYIVIMMLFSISNGYVSSICMISGPQVVAGEEASTAANLMVACLGLGLGVGAFISNFLVKLI